MNENEEQSLLTRTVTFRQAPKVYNADTPLLRKVLGTKTAPTNRVSESLDYEAIQNRVYYDRIKRGKEGKKKLYG